MARRQFSRPLRQGQRRLTEWVQSADVTGATGIAAGSCVLLQSITEAALLAQGLLPSTIIRTRGMIYTSSDQTAAEEDAFGALSMAVTSEPARAAGVASLLCPIIDEDADAFFVYETWLAGNSGPSTGALFGRPWYMQKIDSKAQRKVEDGNAVVMVAENGSAAAGARLLVKLRMLFKLH